MGWTQKQHDALERAIAEGAETVRYEDRTVTYRSLDDMLKLLASMKASLGMNAGATLGFKATTDKEA